MGLLANDLLVLDLSVIVTKLLLDALGSVESIARWSENNMSRIANT